MQFWVTTFWVTAGLLAYVHLGYALILLVAGAATRKRSGNASTGSHVSLVIPAHNEEAVLRDKLSNALALDYPRERLEIIVASDGSSDRTIEIAREFESRGVRVLDFSQRRGKASVVNDAVAEAEGELLCLCDANVMFRPDALSLLVGRLDDPGVGAATGCVRIASEDSNFGSGESFYYRFERAIQVGESRIGSLMGVDGGMYVMRRELFSPLPPDTILDDFVISMRVVRQGKRVVYEPDAVADENATPKAAQEFRRRVRVAAGAVQSLKRGDFPSPLQPVCFWEFLSHKLLRWIGPLLLLLLLVCSALLWQQGGIYRIALIGQIAFYAMAALALVFLPFRRTRLGGIPFYFVMSHVAIAVGTVRGLFNRQRVTWAQAERQTTESSPDAAATLKSPH